MYADHVRIRSYRLSKDLEPTDHLIFLTSIMESRNNVDVKGDGMKEGCHDLGIGALNFMLRSKGGLYSGVRGQRG